MENQDDRRGIGALFESIKNDDCLKEKMDQHKWMTYTY